MVAPLGELGHLHPRGPEPGGDARSARPDRGGPQGPPHEQPEPPAPEGHDEDREEGQVAEGHLGEEEGAGHEQAPPAPARAPDEVGACQEGDEAGVGHEGGGVRPPEHGDRDPAPASLPGGGADQADHEGEEEGHEGVQPVPTAVTDEGHDRQDRQDEAAEGGERRDEQGEHPRNVLDQPGGDGVGELPGADGESVRHAEQDRHRPEGEHGEEQVRRTAHPATAPRALLRLLLLRHNRPPWAGRSRSEPEGLSPRLLPRAQACHATVSERGAPNGKRTKCSGNTGLVHRSR